jgi:ketosteroid isomerase-like protein
MDETTRATIEAVERLDAAFDRGDVDAFLAAMTDDCVWESFTPAPDGRRHEGQAAVVRLHRVAAVRRDETQGRGP